MVGADSLIGTVLNERFRVGEVYASGGTTRLYKAADTTSGEPLAVRVLHGSRLTDKQAIKRFQNAVNATKYLDHPNIVPVIAAGTTSQGAPYLVQPFVEGTNVRQLIQRDGVVSLEEIEAIMREVGAAIEAIHKQGVVHRNLKPGNIIISQRNGQRQIYLTGLGLARVSDPAKISITHTKKVVGSPTYMSPEQFTQKNIDGRADIYSFGCLIYEMISGKPPFSAQTVLHLMSKHFSEPPRPFTEVCPQWPVPAYLSDIVFGMMQKLPEDRYQTMSDVIEDLNNRTCRIANKFGHADDARGADGAAGARKSSGLAGLMELARRLLSSKP